MVVKLKGYKAVPSDELRALIAGPLDLVNQGFARAVPSRALLESITLTIVTGMEFDPDRVNTASFVSSAVSPANVSVKVTASPVTDKFFAATTADA
jgi:hypothetical protein